MSAAHAATAEVRLYDHLFVDATPRLDGGLADETQLDDIHKAQQQRVDEATAFALDSPPPDPAEMEYALYAD